MGSAWGVGIWNKGCKKGGAGGEFGENQGGQVTRVGVLHDAEL